MFFFFLSKLDDFRLGHFAARGAASHFKVHFLKFKFNKHLFPKIEECIHCGGFFFDSLDLSVWGAF